MLFIFSFFFQQKKEEGELYSNLSAVGNIDFLTLRSDIKVKDNPSVSDSNKQKKHNDSVFTKKSDSLSTDSTAHIMTARDSMAIDSLARIKNFTFRLKDRNYIPVNPERKYSLFTYPSHQFFRRQIQLDSTGRFVLIKEYIGKQEIRNALKIPIDEYIKLKMQNVNKSVWEKLAYKYELKENKNDLGQLITDITNIDIPLPSLSFLSIFGKPGISLRINGAVDIHGAWRNETTEGVTASLLGNTRNEPDFKQQVQINVNGTIGDKLKISADWNTERTFEYKNQLKLKYTGYEDEIIQSIEAGNVSLQTSPLVGGSDALFGIKAKFQMGPFTLTTIASQKKSEVQEVSVTGGSQKSEFTVHAYEYSQNHFFVDTAYASTAPNLNLFNRYYGPTVPDIDPTFRIKEIEVWKTTTAHIDPQKERRGNAFINLDPRVGVDTTQPNPYSDNWRSSAQNPIPGQSVIGSRFVLLTQDVDYEYNPYVGVITFKTQIQDNEAVAVAYRVEGPPGGVDNYYGEFLKETGADTSATIVLKLIKPPQLQPGGTFTEAWRLQLKNIYPIGGRDIKKEGFKLDVEYNPPGQEPVNNVGGVNLLQAFKLDTRDESGTGGPDGAFDWDPGRTILPKSGEIIFPVIEPFGKEFPLSDKSLAYQSVYDTTVTFAKQDNVHDRFVLKGEYSALSSSVYNIGFSAVENSVRVTLNGRELKAGSDYAVDYNIGQVIIRNEAALVPGANLKISYEKNDLFQLASKTLVGARGLYDFSKRTKLGFSFLNLNQKTLSDKVRIGEEPLNNSIFGVDFKTGVDLPFITKGIDYLFSTKEMSSLNLSGEFAYMNPDPNTKKSTISSDQSKSIAYIDDFEGAKRIIPIGISYIGWRDLSVPVGLPVIGNRPLTDQMRFKGKSFWYNVLPSNVNVKDIWGDRKKVAREDQQVTVLDYVFDPSKPGFYNHDPNLSVPSEDWGGIMKGLSSTASNLVEENIKFIEFWVRVVDAPEGAKLNIDLGQISEDVIPNNILDTEDKNQNDLVDDGEDTGLDGLFDAQEKSKFGSTENDPNKDDFAFAPGSFVYDLINGTEGNAKLITGNGKIPDTEDLNRNFTLDRVNSFFRYEIPIDTNEATNPFISGSGANKGWYQFRIPLREATDSIGNPSFTVIESVRFWVSGVNKPVHLRFAELNLVGNQWQKVLVPGKVDEKDTTLVVSTINIEDNPEYTSPPGLTRERDRSKPDQNVFKNEQSLLLTVNDLQDGDNREIVKYLFRPLDVFNYREMKLFVHGNLDDKLGSISYFNNPSDYGAEVYFRFGSDTANFYEYRQPVKPGWNEIDIPFSELTAIKQLRTDETQLFRTPVKNQPGNSYGIKGNPTLTRINFFTFGIVNPVQENTGPVSGELWINELRVLGADDTKGWAYRANASLKLADLISANFNMSQTDPYFHKLNERFGRRVDSKNWGASVNLDVLKLIPFNLSGSTFKVTYSRNESVAKPLYLPGTDVNVEEAAKKLVEKRVSEGASQKVAETEASNLRSQAQTLNVSDTWAIPSIKFKFPSKKWYIRDIINGLSFSFNFNKSRSRSPSTVFASRWVWNASSKYSLNFSKDNFFYPANIPIIGEFFQLFKNYRNVKVYFTPQSFNTGFSASRKRSANLNRAENSKLQVQRDFTAKRNFSFNWKLTEGGFFNLTFNYNVNVASSYAYLLTLNGIERRDKDIWHDIFNGQLFGKDYRYTQSFDIRTRPQLPTLWDLNKYFTLNASYSVNYTWQNNFTQEELGRSAGFSNRLNTGLTLKLKSLMAPLFKEEKKNNVKASSFSRNNRSGRGRRNRRETESKNVDKELNKKKKNEKEEPHKVKSLNAETEEAKQDSIELANKPPLFGQALNWLKLGAKWLLFDYEQININFSQSNSKSGSGLSAKGTGFTNFWGVNQNENNGPSRLFMLGFSYDVGKRAPNGNLSDNFSQKNNMDLKTSRPLWEGASIDINWKLGWGINKTTRLHTDENSNIIIDDITSTGNINKTFLYFPLFISKAGISKVHEIYDQDQNKDLASAFVQGFESLPLFSKLPLLSSIAKFVPRPNWRINWRGLEKISFLKGFAQSISLSHAYSSGYTEGWKIDPDGRKQIQTQRITYGFSPLVGMNVSFKKLLDGNLTGSVKYSAKSSFDLGVSTRNINETLSRDINITASFSKSGFNIPLFGLSLKNDVEISFSYTSSRNSVVVYEMDNYKEGGTPQDGTTRTSIEPRIKYVMSSKVTLSLFYKRTSVVPEGASRIPPTTTNEAGLDVHISIQ